MFIQGLNFLPLLGDSCERGFLIWRVEEGIFLDIKKKIYILGVGID